MQALSLVVSLRVTDTLHTSADKVLEKNNMPTQLLCLLEQLLSFLLADDGTVIPL